MPVAASVIEAIGDTPLIRLNRASDATGCEILGKAEFMNPGGSVKDRAALGIIRDAEARGLLQPGGLIVEGSAGNTGIGLAMVGRALGYRTLVVIPRTQSEEKKDAIRLAGAELLEVDAAPYSDPRNFVRVSKAVAQERGAFWADQFDNLANREAHRTTTGPEILEQTGGRVDGFICAIGSGGTLAGVAQALRAEAPEVRIGLADPLGASMFDWFVRGELVASAGTSITEGIGQARAVRNIEGLRIDFACQPPDDEALQVLFDLVQHEGLALGGSAGINVAGAIRMAKHLGPGHTVVTILCDAASRYASKLFNPTFLRERGLPTPPWM